ncbi:MAG: ABC transporter substrate-binding protein, partial [Caldimonas sp.]
MKTTRLIRSLVAGFAGALLIASAGHAQTAADPIRVGFLSVRSGALAAGGKQMEEGINLFLKERNNTLAGRKVELIVVDTGGTPAQARTKTQELVEKNNVHVIIGPLATFEALAIDDYIAQVKVPLITPTSAAQKDLAQQKQSDYVIHAVGTAAQPMHVLGDFAAKKLGIKRVAAIADDFTYGHEGVAGFQAVFEEAGGRVVQKLWPPLNVGDY